MIQILPPSLDVGDRKKCQHFRNVSEDTLKGVALHQKKYTGDSLMLDLR